MLTRAENERLCRLGPATEMGRMMRRYWLPAVLSADLPARGARRPIRILGEDFVALRDASGRAALLRDGSPHEAVYEAGGFAWIYLGPPQTAPQHPDFAFTVVPETHRIVLTARIEANYLQCLEGVVDSAHSNYLHRSKAILERPSSDGAPRIEVQDTAYGFRYGAIRVPARNPEGERYVRITHFVAPFHATFPAPAGWGSLQMFVPLDDEHTMFHFVRWSETPIDDAERERQFAWSGTRKGIDLDDGYRKIRTKENNWLQDRERMRTGESFSGISGVNNEDFAVGESMGPIYDRTREHLGTSDVAVIRLRRLMLDSIRDFIARGRPPIGLREPFDYRMLRGEEQTIALDVPWQTVSAPAGEHLGV